MDDGTAVASAGEYYKLTRPKPQAPDWGLDCRPPGAGGPVRAALKQTPGKVIHRWYQSHLGPTAQSQRQAAFAAYRQAQETAEEPIAAST